MDILAYFGCIFLYFRLEKSRDRIEALEKKVKQLEEGVNNDTA